MTAFKNYTQHTLTLPELCDHIVENHHCFERNMIGNIQEHLKVIAEVETKGPKDIASIQALFSDLTEKLEEHITSEEQFIFPFAKKFNSLPKEERLAHFSELRHAVDLLIKLGKKQKGILDDLHAIRDLTRNFDVQVNFAPTHKLCLEELERLDWNIQQHFSLENNELVRKMEGLEDTTHKEEQIVQNDKQQ